VDSAVGLANESGFLSTVRAAIRAGLAQSTLTDMLRHTRALEAAYEEALARAHPHVLAETNA
jgi:predicted O-linked N-acetylglucosamine transferase (SPINDLY family)